MFDYICLKLYLCITNLGSLNLQPLCVNVLHLLLFTFKVNSLQKIKRG